MFDSFRYPPIRIQIIALFVIYLLQFILPIFDNASNEDKATKEFQIKNVVVNFLLTIIHVIRQRAPVNDGLAIYNQFILFV